MKHQLTNKVLKEVSEPVTIKDNAEHIEDLIKSMWHIVRGNNPEKRAGVGIAANQVGVLKRVIILNTSTIKRVFINPEIIKASKNSLKYKEGCLSFPPEDTRVMTRAKQVTVQALDEKLEPFKMKLRGLDSVCVQHEIDHLNGITIFDGRKNETT